MSFPMLLPSSMESSTESSKAGQVLLRPSDITLSMIFAELTAARSANQLDRGVSRPGAGAGARSDRLLLSLEACVAALTDRNLPIPPSIRDELRLRRRLLSDHT